MFELTEQELAQCRKWFEQRDGSVRAAYSWPTTRTEPRASLLIVPGLGEHGGRYRACAQPFQNAGVNVWAIDLIGHGHSPGVRGCIHSYVGLLDEIQTGLEWIQQSSRGLPLLLWGHSMGGNLALNYLLQRSVLPQRAIASGPMLRPTRPPSAAYMWLARQLERRLPDFTLKAPVRVEQCTSDPIMQAASRADKLFHSRLSLRLGAGLIDSGEWALNHAAQLRTPLLLAHSTHDAITSSAASVQFAERCGDPCNLRLYPNQLHDIHRDIGRTRVLAEFVSWMLQ
jgi:acylglycerol lipase